MLFSILGPSSLPVVAAQPDECQANRTTSVLGWYNKQGRRQKNFQGGEGNEKKIKK